MFRIISHQSLPDGKSRIVVETDDFTSSLMLRFLSEADKFAQLFQYRIRTESRLELSQKSKSENLVQVQESRARLLKMYREIPGTVGHRVKVLQEKYILKGEKITQDRIIARLKLAREEEKKGKIFQIKGLIKKGKSLDEIAVHLEIPKSTVARYLGSVRGGKQSQARVKRSVLAIAESPPEPSSTAEPPSTPLPSKKFRG